ncbi:hypothetical protein [Halorussus caseinilyticus]|uniref:hypothetical protein n=1 Tax=Halorussus caseinilyticus TaxID=3034025 RepID=UPI0036D3883F
MDSNAVAAGFQRAAGFGPLPRLDGPLRVETTVVESVVDVVPGLIPRDGRRGRRRVAVVDGDVRARLSRTDVHLKSESVPVSGLSHAEVEDFTGRFVHDANRGWGRRTDVDGRRHDGVVSQVGPRLFGHVDGSLVLPVGVPPRRRRRRRRPSRLRSVRRCRTVYRRSVLQGQRRGPRGDDCYRGENCQRRTQESHLRIVHTAPDT